MPLLIRAATLADVPALVRLNAVVQELHVRVRPDYYRRLEGNTVQRWFSETLVKPQCTTWLALLDEFAVGYVLSMAHHREATPFTHARSWLEFEQVAVDPAARNRGIGYALLTHAIAAARDRGHAQVELTTWGFNVPGQALFRKVGFDTKYLRLELGADTNAPTRE